MLSESCILVSRDPRNCKYVESTLAHQLGARATAPMVQELKPKTSRIAIPLIKTFHTHVMML